MRLDRGHDEGQLRFHGGDSGGPYWFGDAQTNPPLMAMGLHVHSQVDSGSAKGWYTPINLVLGQLALRKDVYVDLCLDSNC